MKPTATNSFCGAISLIAMVLFPFLVGAQTPPQYWPPQWRSPWYAPVQQPTPANRMPATEPNPPAPKEKAQPEDVEKAAAESKAAGSESKVKPASRTADPAKEIKQPKPSKTAASQAREESGGGKEKGKSPTGQARTEETAPASASPASDGLRTASTEVNPAATREKRPPRVIVHAPKGSPAQQARNKEALGHMRRGDYAKAYCIWNELASAGLAEAQFSLGWMYHNGYGLGIDNERTVHWWTQAADQGLGDAAFALAMLYSQGDVERDLARAVRYYQQADAAGNEDARPMLAQLFARHADEMRDIVGDWGVDDWRDMATPVRVKVPRANVRLGPSTDTKLLESFGEGTELLQLFKEGKWVRAMHPDDGRMFWIYSTLIERA